MGPTGTAGGGRGPKTEDQLSSLYTISLSVVAAAWVWSVEVKLSTGVGKKNANEPQLASFSLIGTGWGWGSTYSGPPLSVFSRGTGALPVSMEAREDQIPTQPHKHYPVGEADTP